jgi:hypothetical protein
MTYPENPEAISKFKRYQSDTLLAYLEKEAAKEGNGGSGSTGGASGSI